jgi:hypothetical protein
VQESGEADRRKRTMVIAETEEADRRKRRWRSLVGPADDGLIATATA